MSGDANPSNDLALQITNLLKTTINSPKQSPSDSLKISINLNSHNYALWARMVRVAIGGKSKTLLSHLSEKPPDELDAKYEQWEQDDLIVFSWLIQNIEPSLASNLTEFPTTKTLWDALVVTYSSGKDKLQTFDLHVKANELKQNNLPLEDFWIAMQGIWGEIERRDPNPMTYTTDIATYNLLRSEQKLFQFLNALDRRYDPIKREVLRWDPLPSAEGAYAAVRKEMAHQGILGSTTEESLQTGVAVGLVANGPHEGSGFMSKGRTGQMRTNTRPPPRIDKSKLKCDNCGMTKHTKEQCFEIIGYPDWWSDGHKKGSKITRQEKGRVFASVGNPEATNSDGNQTGGFVAMAAGDEEERDQMPGYQDGSDHWAWHLTRGIVLCG